MRLIDADTLCKKIRKIYDGYMMDECGCCPLDFENMVDEQPTAYNMEKVAGEIHDIYLDEAKHCEETIKKGGCHTYIDCSLCLLAKAEEIVRRGGVE